MRGEVTPLDHKIITRRKNQKQVTTEHLTLSMLIPLISQALLNITTILHGLMTGIDSYLQNETKMTSDEWKLKRSIFKLCLKQQTKCRCMWFFTCKGFCQCQTNTLGLKVNPYTDTRNISKTRALIIRNGSKSISFGTPPSIVCNSSLVKACSHKSKINIKMVN